jgi:hypothetical protein
MQNYCIIVRMTPQPVPSRLPPQSPQGGAKTRLIRNLRFCRIPQASRLTPHAPRRIGHTVPAEGESVRKGIFYGLNKFACYAKTV